MPLDELNAQELARIDAICFAFEQDLRRKLATAVPPQHASPSQNASPPLQGAPHCETSLAETLDIDAQVAMLTADEVGLAGDLLREELLAVANEILMSANNSPIPPSDFDDPKQALTSQHNRNSSPDPQAASGWLQPGMQIGPYLVDQRIGRGGMGEVYRGRDVRLGREVAIKVLVHDWSEKPEHADRFEREARAVATLSHPSIVSLYDIGSHVGRPFAVMELLKGETLRDHLRSNAPLAPSEVRRIGAAAAEALDVAHQAGIIHRDLKPENLFLTNDRRIKLLDFGLSRINDGAAADDATMTGVIMGTMGYLSPEQASGKASTSAADLFSLGCVLHECFYGKRPFRGETTPESLAATISGEPTVDPVRAALDPALAELIARCLEKSPDDRPSSAGEISRLLLASPASRTSDTEIQNRPTISEHSSRTLTSRRTWLRTMGIATASLAGLGAIYGGLRWSTKTHSIRSIAVLPLADSGPPGGEVDGMELRGLGEGEQLAAAIADQLTHIPSLRVVPFLPLRESRLLAPEDGENDAWTLGSLSPESLKMISQRLGVDSLLVGSVSIDDEGFRTIKVVLVEGRTGTQVVDYRTRVKPDENLIAQVETARRVAEGVGGKLEDYRAGKPRDNETYHCLLNGYSRMDSESVGALRDALKCFESAIYQDEKFAEAYSGLALTSMLLVSQVEFDERNVLLTSARQALSMIKELGDHDGQALLAEAMMAWQVDWDFDKAANLFEQIVPAMPDNWVAQHEYAFFLAARGDLNTAQKYADRAVGLDPTSTAFRIDAARLRWFAGDWQTALAEMRATAALAKDDRLEQVRGATLDLLESVGRWDEAQALLTGKNESFSAERYWTERELNLEKIPYGPYDAELNLLLLRIRRGDFVSDQALSEIKLHRPPRLPFLLTAHPTLVVFQDSKIFQDANCQI